MKPIILYFGFVFILSACSSSHQKPLDCTGLKMVLAEQYNKNTHLFMRHDKKMIDSYGLEKMSEPKTLRLNACSPLIPESNQEPSFVRISSSGWYGENGYLHCVHQSNDSSKEIYRTFIDWAKQPLAQREQTLQQINEKIKTLNCSVTSAAKEKTAWYVENEQHDKTPVLVSNARDSILLKNAFANRTIAITPETASAIYDSINQYFRKHP
ncbi:hypothetical protein QG085_02700 [Kingella kingae]|uniref:hypothetical protein n=1 Tax=Kingella kingae TaxID=504 RepID=UPI00056F0032|nr:hypothetical protein [Kingella kingae]MDK4544435.1 hypothetical protein [Kingella kingae]MDK4566342.1 hypothetical protein [Kingella kingae]MDK4590859.1 hypothetical protein [Kingella kingae]MDK4628107.1 hypothetical protein [Kingella kingae]MDK4635955.1 hypothetical protein [Kingella kingae]